MTMGQGAESLIDGDPCVAEFLARHGIAKQDEDAQQPGQPAASPQPPTPSDTLVFDGNPDQSIEKKLGIATEGVAAAQKMVSPAATSEAAATQRISPAAPNAAAAAAAGQAAKPSASSPPAAARNQLPARRKRDVADQKSADAMRQLRSVANSISVSISRSNQVKDKLNEATRYLAMALLAGLAALGLACFTSTAQSIIFFAAMIALVLGLLCAYRTTMIMTRLRRVAKL